MIFSCQSKHRTATRTSRYHSALIRVASILAFTIFLSACSRHRDPQAVYDHARKTFYAGDMQAAEKEAEAGYNEFHNVSSDWAWTFLLLRGSALHRQNLDDEILRILAAEKTPGPSGELAVKKLGLEGRVFMSLHNVKEAEKAFVEAEGICSTASYSTCADVAGYHGALEMNRGRYSQAQVFFARVLPTARASADEFWIASSMLDLSWAANEQTHFDEAVDWSAAARTIAVQRSFPGLAQAALGDMGWAYYKLGEAEKAEGMLLEAEQQAKKLSDTSDQLKWLLDLGYVYSDSGDLSAAEQSYRQSLDLATKVKTRGDIINALQALAFVSEQTGKLDDANRYADEALSMARADGNKRDETYPRLVQGRVAARQHDPATAEAAFHEVAESNDSPVFLKWEAERSLAHLYEDENQPDVAAREYRTALSTFESARSELQHESSRLPFLTNASGIYDDYIHFLVASGKTQEGLQAAEYDRGRTLAEGLGLLQPGTSFKPDALNAQAIAGRAGGTILFYWLGDRQSYLWAITPRKTELFTLPPKSQIDPFVQRYRKALAEQQEFLPTADADGRSLYRTLVAPAQALLPKNARVVIIPDGSLNTLNFETLLVAGLSPDSPPHYWIEDVTIADASSLRLLAAARNSSGLPQRLKPPSRGLPSGTAGRRALPGFIHGTLPERGSLLLLGNAVAPNADYPELRKAAAEMESIEKHFAPTQQQIFTREQATPVAYLGHKPQQFSYIHFVAHGTASRTSPLDSAIVLSRASAEDDSFKLYARDIIHSPLRADLVTISTCYGAGARAYSGEGLVGLSWAFLRAGAHNVIGALWEVSDVSTPQLMDELYGGLMKGRTPDAALRDAKLSLLHSGNAFRKPFYWAPFQLYTGS
jgi:CHAT domain-containing protein